MLVHISTNIVKIPQEELAFKIYLNTETGKYIVKRMRHVTFDLLSEVYEEAEFDTYEEAVAWSQNWYWQKINH